MVDWERLVVVERHKDTLGESDIDIEELEQELREPEMVPDRLLDTDGQAEEDCEVLRVNEEDAVAVGLAVTDRELVVDNEEHVVAVRHRVTEDEAVFEGDVEEHTELDKLLVPESVFVAEEQLEEDAEEHWLTVEE